MTFPADQLAALAEALEVEIETRPAAGPPSHRTVIWIVVDDGQVYVRSVRGPQGRWFRELAARGKAVVHVGRLVIPVRGVVTDAAQDIARCSHALERKYAGDPALRSMLRDEVLSTTVRLEPA